MKRGSTTFLKTVLVLIGLSVLSGLLFFPTAEGRNVNHNLFQIYFQDPFLAYIYLTSIPFFWAIYQAFKLLGLIEHSKTFTKAGVHRLRNIKYCALAFAVFVLPTMPYIFAFAHDDDSPGVVLIGVVLIFAAIVVATAAAVFQALLQNAVDIKSENDLTV